MLPLGDAAIGAAKWDCANDDRFRLLANKILVDLNVKPGPCGISTKPSLKANTSGLYR